jgi:molecular chaperone DnaK
MSRTTIDFGIDLGTTNSAIAVLRDVTPEIIKNDVDADITPSAVSIDKKGTIYHGQRAKNRVIDHHKDTYLEFKRRMGTDWIYQFKSSGQKRSPEELSAEVLKSLLSDVQQRTGEVVEAAVVTVPAAFELHQCDATRKAAYLAGLKQSPLLMEPTAASLAYGFQKESPKAYWLVYDFGGGTFDAALMKTEDGTIHMVNHGGDNFLGGSDFDWALVEKIIATRFLSKHPLPEFDRGHSGDGQPWRQIFAKSKWVGEDVKIQLTRRDKATFELKDLKEEGGNFACDFFECEITRNELIAVAEPIILRSVEICKRVLKEKSLGKEDVERVILVGGPTLAPYFRDILASHLGIPLDYSVDPLTVVAKGAAVFAGTQKVSHAPRPPVAAGEYALDLKYQPVGLDSAPVVGGKVSGSRTQDFSGFKVELVNIKTQWRSGKIELHPDGVFMANLHAERGERNTFVIELWDPGGRKQKVSPDHLTYTVGVGGDAEQPLIIALGIALADNSREGYFEKGKGLPQKRTAVFKTIQALRQGQTGEVLRFPVVEGENDFADRNRFNGVLEIRGDQIRRDLPAGSDVEVTLRIDESRIVTVKAYVPLLDEEFETKIDMRRHNPNPDFLRSDFEAEMKRFREVKASAASASAQSAEELVQQVEQSPLLKEVRETLPAAKGDVDAALKCEKRLQELKLKLDEAANALEWPALVKKAREWCGYLWRVANQLGSDAQKQRTDDLADEIEDTIRDGQTDRLRKKIEHASRLYFEIVMAQPGWWVDQFQQVEKQQREMTDQGRAARLLDQGRECLDKNNTVGLQNVVRQLWDLLPQETVEATKRAYGATIMR